MGFYDEIKNNYGNGVVIDLKLWANSNTRMAKANSRRNFLLRCRSHGIIPRHIKQNIKCIYNLVGENAEDSRKAINLGNKVASKLLNLEISIIIKKINSLRASLAKTSARFESVLPEHILIKYKQTQSKSFDRVTANCTSILKNKFESLYKNFFKDIKVKDSWFVNLTEHVFSQEISHLLKLGPKFTHSVPAKNLSIKSILADSEVLVNLAPLDMKDILRAKSTNAITNFIHSTWCQENPIHMTFLKTAKYLQEHRDIVVTMADKGNITVAISRRLYEEKMNSLIGDTEVYKKLSSDPTSKIQSKNNSLVKELKDKEFIDGNTAKKLNSYKGVSPTIYGLPKIHKERIPLRPIVSTINSPTSDLSKFMANILKIAFDDSFHIYAVRDSFMFSEKVNNLKIPADHVLVSLDAVSLFTNISWDLTRDTINTEWEKIRSVTNIPLEEFIRILKFLFDSNYFKYKDEFFSQIFGCPMGSNLSPILASLAMTVLIRFCLDRLSFRPFFLYQYVDDLILTIPLDGKQELLNIFNSFNQYIQFTIEEEKDNFVPFLDTKVIRTNDNIIKLDWYRKPTSSGRYIHYKSNHDWQMKINVVNNLKNRILKIAHPDYQHDSLNTLYKILRDNGYPHGFLKRLIFCTSTNQNGSNNLEPTHEPTRSEGDVITLDPRIKFASLPSLPGLTNKLINIFSIIENLKIAKYNVVTNRFLFSRLKDKIPTMSKSDCIYSIPCVDCSNVYIGQTSQALRRRISLHKSDIRLHPDRCALASHAKNNGHNFNFNNTKILSIETNNDKRLFLEMCYINEQKNVVNKKADIKGLSSIYSYLLSIDNSFTKSN